jgi:UDPglucose 6-dehydrogenase
LPDSNGPFGSIGIIGVGVVGGALKHYLESEGVAPLVYDRDQALGSMSQVGSAGLVFVCVPTPYRPGYGFDDSAVEEAISALPGGRTVVIKSTVLPGTTERYQRRFPSQRLLFNPEFLRERTAVADFLRPDRQIVGYSCGGQRTAEDVLALLPRAPYEAVIPATAAELAKYATNAFLAVKVIFANELYDLAAAVGADYATVSDAFAADERIGGSHLDVLDSGYRGYGGKCLPKDTMSLLDLAAELGVAMRLLEAAHQANQALRTPGSIERRPASGEALAAEAAAILPASRVA